MRRRIPGAADTHDAEVLVVWTWIGSLALALPPGATWGFEGFQQDAYLGLCSGVLDANGDGFDDVFAGAHGFDHPQDAEGGVVVFLGSSVGLPAAPDWKMEGDQVGANAGSCAARAGDVNGDGYDDLVVGLSGYSHGETEEGAARLYLGGPRGLAAAPSWAIESDVTYAGLGRGVGTAGDVNGDGYDDLVVGAPWRDGTLLGAGEALVYLGGSNGPSTTPDWTMEGYSEFGYYGFSVTTARDVNADGYDDLLVGAYASGRVLQDGAAYLYLGSATGLSTVPAWSVRGGQRYAELGVAVAGIGDVDGDGYDDVAVGADRASDGQQEEGVVSVYLGSAAGPSATPDWTAEADRPYAEFGWALGGGDLDGDGFSDLAIGAPDIAYGLGQGGEGAVFVYTGSAAGLTVAPVARLEANQAGAGLGHSLAVGADTDGDGHRELVAGANQWAGAHTDEGGVFVYEAP